MEDPFLKKSGHPRSNSCKVLLQMFEQDGDFDSTSGLLSGSLKRINYMVNSGKGNRKLMCYLIAGLIVLFFVLFYVISWLRTSWYA